MLQINNINNLTTPNEWVLHYYNELKRTTEKTDVLLSRNGFLGFFLEVLGNQQFDTKYYYDFLFKEAFPITATSNKNLLYHANLYNFVPQLANPSVLSGNFLFDLNYLYEPTSDTYKREIIFDNVLLKIGSMDYIMTYKYHIEIFRITVNNFKYIVNIETPKGNIKKELTHEDSYCPIYGLVQQYNDSIQFTIGNYPFGSFLQKIITSNKKFLVKIIVEVKPFNSKDWQIFDSYQNKDYFGPDDKVVFYSILPNNDILLEFGSGEKGYYINNSDIRVTIITTDGEKGNILLQSSDNFFGRIGIFDYNINGEQIYSGGQYNNVKGFITAEIEYGTNGKDPLIGDKLRIELIKYIQSRENLISELDFKNIIVNYYNTFEIMFKKIDISVNTFFIYIGLKKKFFDNIPIYSSTVSVLKSDFEANTKISSNGDKYIFEPQVIINDKRFISPFLYKFNNTLRVYDGYNVLYKPVFYPYYSEKSTNISTFPIIYLELDFKTTYTRINIKSYNSIDMYDCYISSHGLSLSNKKCIFEDSIFYHEHHDELIDKDYIEISLINNGKENIQEKGEKILFKFEKVYQLTPISELLRLKPFMKPDRNDYILNLQIIDYDEYIKDIKYYNTKFINDLFGETITNNRMISDEIGVRFLNNYFIEKKYLSKISIQNYNFDLVLPFKLKIDLIIDKNLINNIDTDVYNLHVYIADWLNKNQTGTTIKFYKSHIHQLIHDYSLWVKSCNVTLYDSVDFEIPNSNIETIKINKIIDIMPKDDILDFAPIYYWFDIDNIILDYKFTK